MYIYIYINMYVYIYIYYNGYIMYIMYIMYIYIVSTVDHLASLVPRVCRFFDPWHVPRVNSPCWRRRLHGRNLHRLDRLLNWNCGWSILGIPRCAQLSATFDLTSSYFHGKNHLLHPIDHPFYICYMDLHDLTWLIMLSHFGIDV